MTDAPADRRLVSSGSPFERTYGYSRAVVSGDEVHIAGTTAYHYATTSMPNDPAEQTRNIYATFATVLKDAGGGLSDIVRLRTYVTDAADCKPALKVQGAVFGSLRPAGTIVVVSVPSETGNESRDRGGRAPEPAGLICRKGGRGLKPWAFGRVTCVRRAS
jgi:enamine deaminase RidA (YjgF/YER057c/UK114 family)